MRITDKSRQYLWFVGLWFAGLGGVLLLALAVKTVAALLGLPGT